MQKRMLCLVVLAMALIFAVPMMAGASQISVTYTLGSSVSYVRNSVAGSTATAEFDATLKNYQASGSDFNAIGYCVDLDHTISANTLYDVGELQQFAGFSEKQKEAAWLIHKFAPGITGAPGSNLGTTIAALQSAIWTVFYDTGAGKYDIGAGNFYLASTVSSSIRTLAQSMLNTLPTKTGGSIGLGTIKWSGHAKNLSQIPGGAQGQSLMLASKVVPTTTPEPGSLILFGSALFGGGFLRRRKMRKASKKD